MPVNPAVEFEGVSKRFGGVTALDQVQFVVRAGEIHAVMGANGAGKSTLMKLLAGVHLPDAGCIRIHGQPVRMMSPKDARRHGISIVFQELNLFPHRTVTANVFVNQERRSRWGLVDGPAMETATEVVLTELGARISPRSLVGSLSIGEQQFVEIARALAQRSHILILDEPNSALTEAESQRLFAVIRAMRDRGLTIIYVSHRLTEVFAIADCVTVLRDGRYQGTWLTKATTVAEVVSQMIGRSLSSAPVPRSPQARPGTPILDVRGLRGPFFGPIGFTARTGEIVGFAGMEGCGIDELFATLFGLAETPFVGDIQFQGTPYRPASPQAAIRRGWALIPARRREEGLMMEWPASHNATLLLIKTLRNALHLIQPAKIRSSGQTLLTPVALASRGGSRITHLSGGNQQKVLLAKWLAIKPAILVLNDPARGVDVGAKAEIFALCRQLAQEGTTILVTASEVEEILEIADRILVMVQGRLQAEFDHNQMTRDRVLQAMLEPGPVG